MTTDDERLPRWAAVARSVFRAVLGIYVIFWIISAIVWVIDALIVDLSGPSGLATARSVVVIAVLATGAAAGLVWLAGEAVSGFREPKD